MEMANQSLSQVQFYDDELESTQSDADIDEQRTGGGSQSQQGNTSSQVRDGDRKCHSLVLFFHCADILQFLKIIP